MENLFVTAPCKTQTTWNIEVCLQTDGMALLFVTQKYSIHAWLFY